MNKCGFEHNGALGTIARAARDNKKQRFCRESCCDNYHPLHCTLRRSPARPDERQSTSSTPPATMASTTRTLRAHPTPARTYDSDWTGTSGSDSDVLEHAPSGKKSKKRSLHSGGECCSVLARAACQLAPRPGAAGDARAGLLRGTAVGSYTRYCQPPRRHIHCVHFIVTMNCACSRACGAVCAPGLAPSPPAFRKVRCTGPG
jgi:hypothetical protein